MVLRTKGSTTRSAFDKAIEGAGVEVQPVMEINNREAVREAVVRGLGIGVVSQSEFIPGERLRALRVTDARMQVDAYVACLAERLDRPLIGAFLPSLKTSLSNVPVKFKPAGQRHSGL